jgi:haloalkane dehalogenase
VTPAHPGGQTRLTAESHGSRLPFRIAACRAPLLGKLAVQGLNAFARGAARLAVRQPLPSAVRRGYLFPYDSWEHRAALHAFVRDIPLRSGDPSWAELAAIERSLESFADRPVLLLWGERDWCFTGAFRAEWQRRFPRARVLRFEDAGHYVFEDAGEPFVRELAHFLDETR